MRILQYNLTTTTKSGGVETFVWELSRALAARGHKMTVLGGAVSRRWTTDDGRWGGGSAHQVPVVRVPFIDRTLFQKLPPLRRMYVLVKLLERASMIPGALPLLAGYDIVHIHKPYDLLAAPLFVRAGARVVLHSHGEDFYPGDKRLVRFVSAILSCSQFNADYTGRRYGLPPTVAYNGFDTDLFVPQPPDLALRDSLLPRSHAALLCVARLQPWKGVGDIIAALPLLPAETTLLVADGGTEQRRAPLVQQARALGVEGRLRFLGDVPNRDLPRYYALADVVVAASYASETFGMALCEAMGCARPVVATRFGGFPEVVAEGVTGLLVPPRDSPALAASIGTLLADPGLRAHMGAAGREHALRLFSWDAVTDRVEAVYRTVTEGRGPQTADRRREP